MQQYLLGIPATPSFGELTPGPEPGEVTIQIKTIASGVSSPSQGFQFNIIPVRDGVEETLQKFVRNDYQSGEFETLTVRDLVPGENYMYTFNATATNFYGTSDAAISRLISMSAGDFQSCHPLSLFLPLPPLSPLHCQLTMHVYAYT